MTTKWPSPVLFAFAAMMFFQGHEQYARAAKLEGAHPVSGRLGDVNFHAGFSERMEARAARSSGFGMEVAGGLAAAVGVVLLGYASLHSRAQREALSRGLAVTYTFVPWQPADGAAIADGVLAEDQAADVLAKRYPTLAPRATTKLREEFAAKRRAEPTKIWFVRDLQVSEVA